jgi:hypothetical protein
MVIKRANNKAQLKALHIALSKELNNSNLAHMSFGVLVGFDLQGFVLFCFGCLVGFDLQFCFVLICFGCLWVLICRVCFGCLLLFVCCVVCFSLWLALDNKQYGNLYKNVQSTSAWIYSIIGQCIKVKRKEGRKEGRNE